MIEVQDLLVRGRQDSRLGPLSLRVERGQRLAVLGPAGAGKSLLLAALAGLVPARGVRCGGSVAMIFQRDALDDAQTALDNVVVAVQARGLADARDRARAALSHVGLAGHGHKLPRTLSGGMRKRVGVARALAVEPDILLADDPTAGLDPQTAREVLALLLTGGRAAQRALVIATQDVDVVLPHVPCALMLDAGEATWMGAPDELGAHPQFAAFAPRRHASILSEAP